MLYPYGEKIELVAIGDEFPEHYAIAGEKRHQIFCEGFYGYENLLDLKVARCTAEEIRKVPLGQPLPRVPESLSDSGSAYEARAFLLKGYSGRGVEFGAATLPLPFPLACDVVYADMFYPDQGSNIYRAGEFVNVDVNTSINDMNGLADESLDFLAGSHIIEHSPNPIEVLQKAYRKLKKGGRLFLVVPHKLYTFDRTRRLTPLEHFVQDFMDYRYNRDALDVMDFIGNIDPGVRHTVDAFGLCRKYLAKEPVDVHYHTFTEESFESILRWTVRHVDPWTHFNIVPRLRDPMEEFYVELLK